MTQKRISLGFLYRGFKGGTWPSDAKKPGYLPETKEFQLLRLHSSTTYILNIRLNPHHWSNWDLSIFLPRLLRPFWWTLLAAWWRLRGARGADEKGWNDYSGPGVNRFESGFWELFHYLKGNIFQETIAKNGFEDNENVSTRTIQYEFHGIFEAAREVSEHSICEDPVTIEHVVFYLQFGSGEGLETITWREGRCNCNQQTCGSKDWDSVISFALHGNSTNSGWKFPASEKEQKQKQSAIFGYSVPWF